MTPKHYYEKNHFYFITTITEKRRPIFKEKISCDLLINLIIYHKFQCSYNIKAFVIMPDHIHFIIQHMGKDNISSIMKKIKGNFSRYYNRMKNTSGTVLQKGFYDSIIRDKRQLYETMEYIHKNPAKNQLVSNLNEYEYSSYNYYCKEDNKFALMLMDTFE